MTEGWGVESKLHREKGFSPLRESQGMGRGYLIRHWESRICCG